MSAVSAVTSGLQAALRLAGGRADGVALVPGDHKTIARSFWSIGLCVPPVIARLLMSWADTGIPDDAAFAATLLILREFMHHLQFASIRISAPVQSE